MIALLKSAVAACEAGKIGEKELLAISLAVNAAMPTQIDDPRARAVYSVFAKTAERDMLARADEIRRGES